MFKSCQIFLTTIYRRQTDLSTCMAKIPPQAFTSHLKDCNSFSLSVTNAAGQHAAVGVMDPRTVLGPLSPLSVTPSTSCLSSPGWLLLACEILSTSLGFDPCFQIGNKAALMLFFTFLHTTHLTGEWGLLAVFARHPLFSSQIKSLLL